MNGILTTTIFLLMFKNHCLDYQKITKQIHNFMHFLAHLSQFLETTKALSFRGLVWNLFAKLLVSNVWMYKNGSCYREYKCSIVSTSILYLRIDP